LLYKPHLGVLCEAFSVQQHPSCESRYDSVPRIRFSYRHQELMSIDSLLLSGWLACHPVSKVCIASKARLQVERISSEAMHDLLHHPHYAEQGNYGTRDEHHSHLMLDGNRFSNLQSGNSSVLLTRDPFLRAAFRHRNITVQV
jgi:hypothetical protein